MIQKILISLYLLCAVTPALGAGRGYLGADFGNLPATERTGRTGVIVKKVFAGMAAEKAGLKPGDIVTQLNGVSILDPKDAVALLAENTAGEKVRLTIERGGNHRSKYLFATMGSRPTEEFAGIMIIPKTPRRHVPTPPPHRHCMPSDKTEQPCRVNASENR